jgi:hypothetical protein
MFLHPPCCWILSPAPKVLIVLPALHAKKAWRAQFRAETEQPGVSAEVDRQWEK